MGRTRKNGFITPKVWNRPKVARNSYRHLRIRLHFLLGRREDRLLFDYQNSIWRLKYGLESTPAKRASEQLMQVLLPQRQDGHPAQHHPDAEHGCRPGAGKRAGAAIRSTIISRSVGNLLDIRDDWSIQSQTRS
jgi:hypothetical protein